MLKKFYLGFGGLLVAGYIGWSLLGFETSGRARDPDPTVPHARTSSSRGTGFFSTRSRGFHFGTGFGFGK